MSEIHNPYGSPCSDAPADATSDSTTASPLNVTPTKPLESLSQSTSTSEQIAALKRQIAELEEEKTCLTKSAADANQRANEAEKRTAAAEAETAAAKQRAQDRYTEKLHANNEVRHLRAAIEKQNEQRRGNLIQVGNCFDGLKAKILELECANKDLEVRNGEKVQSLESQLEAIRTNLSSSEEEKAKLRTESDNIIKDLKKVIMGRQSSLETAEQVKASMKAELAKLKVQMEEQEKEAKAKEASLTKSIQKLKESESSWRLKFNGMQDRVYVLEKKDQAAQQQAHEAQKQTQQQAQVAQKQVQAFQEQTQAAQRQVQTLQQQNHRLRELLEAAKQQAKLELEGAKQQYLMTVRAMRQKALGIHQQSYQQSHQQPHQQLHQTQFQPQPQPQPQGNLLQQTFSPNKRRRLDYNGNAAFDMNGFQPTHTQAFVSSPAVSTQNTLGGSNGVTTIVGTPNHMSKSSMMVPNGGHGQFSSLQSNAPTGPTAAVRQMPQPQYNSQFTVSPMQQSALPPQSTNSMKPQQSPYPQGASLNNVGSLPQNNLPNPQDLPLDFNFDFPQESAPDITIDTLLSMDMSQFNGEDTTFLSNAQGNDTLSGFGNGVMADPSTMGLQDEDLFKDLFNDDTLGLFQDLSDVPAQDQAQTEMSTPNAATSAAPIKRKRHFGQQ